MKRIFALILAFVLLLSLAACGKEEPATTPAATAEPTVVLPTYAQTENPATFFSISMGQNAQDVKSITVYPNEDGTAHLDYDGDVRKVGDFDASLFHGLADALEQSGLAQLNGKDVLAEGEANGSMYIELADGTVLSVTYNGTVADEFSKGYAAMDAFFLEAVRDLPEYVPQPQVMGNVDKALKAQINSILSGSGIEMLDAYAISEIAKDEGFAYAAGLSKADGIEAAASFAPIMSASAYSLVIVTLEEGADAAAVCKDFEDNINWNKWVCVSATNALIATKDNMVLCLMATDAIYAQTQTGITAAGWTAVKTLENP